MESVGIGVTDTPITDAELERLEEHVQQATLSTVEGISYRLLNEVRRLREENATKQDYVDGYACDFDHAEEQVQKLQARVRELEEEKSRQHRQWDNILTSMSQKGGQTERRVRELEATLEEAIEDMIEGWGYASDYMREKWGYAYKVERARAALGERKA